MKVRIDNEGIMQRFVSLPFLAILILTGLAGSSCLLASDLDELLRTDVAWGALSEEEKLPVVPALEALLCAEAGRPSVMNGPPLDPARAYSDAKVQLVASIKAVVDSDVGSGQVIVDRLAPLLSQTTLNASDVESVRPQLMTTLNELSADAPSLQTYIKLAEAIESFLFLDGQQEKYPTAADFSDKLLPELQKTLVDYAAAPRGEPERENLGRLFRLVKTFAAADRTVNIDRLLVELRKLCKKPNLWLFVSDDLINAFVDSAIKLKPETQAVNECILGTSIRGTAVVCPSVSIALRENPAYAALTVKLDGNATSNTVGYQKPVQILATGQTRFWSNKCLDIPAFVTSRASATACTETTICSIQKVGRQCLSRLIERIAWKRARQQKPQAEAIASQKFARRLESSFDERLAPLMTKAKKFYNERVLYALRRLRILPTDPSFSSTSQALGIGTTFGKPDQVGAFRVPANASLTGQTEPDLTVKIHDSFFWNTFDSEKKIPAEALDKLVNEFLSNLPGGNDSALIADNDPQFFRVIAEALLKTEPQRAGFLQENLPSSGKLKLVDVEYKESWIIIHWKMVPQA